MEGRETSMRRQWTQIGALLAVLAVGPVLAQADGEPAVALDPETGVSELLWELGEAQPEHWIEPDAELVRMGREIVTEGRTVGPDGKLSRRASAGYLCTDCHNVVREDPDLTVSDPEARLAYAVEHDLPFLPGTTLWGTVDRASWFNQDYVKKYGDLVQPANRSLRMSVLLCAAECSQGRVLDEWELDAIVAYFWSLRMTLADLALDDATLDLLARAAAGDEASGPAAVVTLRGAFQSYSPAHVREPPADREAGYGNPGDVARGGEVWRRSCLSCHGSSGRGDAVIGTAPFGDDKGTVRALWRERAEAGKGGLYQTLTYGTRPYGVPVVYMPFYTQERLSEQQADDLRAYFADVLGEGSE